MVDVMIEVVEKAIAITVSSIDEMTIKVEMPLMVDVIIEVVVNKVITTKEKCIDIVTIMVEVPVVVDRVMDIDAIILTVETTSEGIGTEQGWGMQGVGINASILHQRRIAKTVVANYRSHWVHHCSQHI